MASALSLYSPMLPPIPLKNPTSSQNPFTVVTLDKGRLLAAAKRALGPGRWRRRAALLAGWTGVLDEDEEPFEVGGWVAAC